MTRPETHEDAAAGTAVFAGLPALPSLIRYYDDYADVTRTIRQLASTDHWPISLDGRETILDCQVLGQRYVSLVKQVLIIWLAKLDPTTVCLQLEQLASSVRAGGLGIFERMLVEPPATYRVSWIMEIAPSLKATQCYALRSFLHALCDLGVGHWHREWHAYVRTLPAPRQDKLRVVRTGDCFVPLDQQSLLIDFFDELTAAVEALPASIDTTDLRDACALLVSFQYAFRPGQIARIRRADARVHATGAVHLAVRLAKRKVADRRRVTRRVKREWCPLFAEYCRRFDEGLGRPRSAEVPVDMLFGLTPLEMGKLIPDLTETITGTPWTTTELRHTAAQRQADAGASHIGLAEFLGHSSVKTANVYFDTSPTQAQRVNEALAISPIYSQIAEIARTRTIDIDALRGRPTDQQIGGVPHGIPIAGIGACTSGQSLCSKNPILSCYTCRRFLPVRDAGVHMAVVESLRPVVTTFAEASRHNETSPAYVQLQRMLHAARVIAADINVEGREEGDHE